MKNYQPYYNHATKEVFNHGIEASLSLFASGIFFITGKAFSYSDNYSAKAVAKISFFISHRFLKDSIIEFNTAIGHLPVINLPGFFTHNLIFDNKNKKDIGCQEAYSQAIEGSNKIMPLLLYNAFFSDSILPMSKITIQTESSTTFIRSLSYYIYSWIKTNSTYINQGHFAQEYELHTELESIILAPPTILGNLYTHYNLEQNSNNYINDITKILTDEFLIEFIKGSIFLCVDKIFPNSSLIKENFDLIFQYQEEHSYDPENLMIIRQANNSTMYPEEL